MTLLIFLLISSIWIPAGDSYMEVEVIYGEIKHCAGYSLQYGDFIKGCGEPLPSPKLQINPNYTYQNTYLGENLWTHEVLHVWGITHAEMEWWKVKGVQRNG